MINVIGKGICSLIFIIVFIYDISVCFSPQTVYAVGINCVPGTFITNTGCQKCPNGTFSDKHNTTKCSPCDRCSGRHNEMVEPCTRSTNTKCSCQAGYYYDEDISFCLKCTPCKKGQGVVKNCTSTSDTQCDFCVKVRN